MLEKIFKNNEVVFYSNINDLSQKINKLMNDDKLRYKIAKAGYVKYHKDMNSNIVTEFMLNKIFNVKSKKQYCWEL
jgi:spore maturation protein CgeB